MAQDKKKLAKIKQRCQKIKQDFLAKHKDVAHWLQRNSMEFDDLKQYSQQIIAISSLAAQLMMTKPVEAQIQRQLQPLDDEDKDKTLAEVTAEEYDEIFNKMVSFVNLPPGHLSQDDELYLEQQLTDMLGFEVTAELEGHRLNHSIGIMGGEQHLRRFPSDSLDKHDAYREAGIAPNRGAFGWFTQNGELTEEAIQNEKYYFAVQTLYLPDWNTNHQELKPWYKFRKMIVINPAERIAVVGVVGDAGPAMWVKKQFGGSPEIIREGKIWSPKARGKIILLFVDDPEDQIVLGPISLEKDDVFKGSNLAMKQN